VIPTGPRTLLFISRMSARKGLEEIIELSHRLADLSGSVRLLLVGGPTLWSDYTGHLQDLNRNVAEYLGGVPSEEMPALMQSAAMLIVPSRYEPGSIVTGEALACGLPVVLSNEVGPSEVVRGPHVRVYPAGDADGLEAAVRSLLAAVESDGPALRAAARANAETQFAPSAVMAELIAMIESLGPRPDEPQRSSAASPVRRRELARDAR
jgi:glycosyltransferase involved in cell wall biosynthesis